MDGYVIVHLVALSGILIPASIQDVCRRSVSTPLVWAGYGVAGVVMSYDLWQGMPLMPGILAGITGVAIGLGLVMMGRRGTILLGEADGHIVAICSILVPWHDGVPVALSGVTVGCVLAAAYCVGKNVAYNLMDLFGGKPILFDADIFVSHRKRRGERFTIRGMRRCPGADSDGIVRSEDGDPFFEKPESCGQQVAYVAPLALYIAAGVFAVSVYVYLLRQCL